MKMYFLPEVDVKSHTVSQRFNGNIKLCREFCDVPRTFLFEKFIKFGKDFVFYTIDWLSNQIVHGKLDQKGGGYKFKRDKIPIRWNASQVIMFDLVPAMGFYELFRVGEIVIMKFSFYKVPGLFSESIEVQDFVVIIGNKVVNNVLNTLNYVAVVFSNLDFPTDRSESILQCNKEKHDFQCSITLYQVVFKMSNGFELVEISDNSLEKYVEGIFVVENMIFNKTEDIILFQLKTLKKIILLVYNLNSRNIEETITVFERERGFEEELVVGTVQYNTRVFFVNHRDYEGGLIIVISDIVQQLKVFRRNKTSSYLFKCVLLNFDDTLISRDCVPYCFSNRNNQIMLFLTSSKYVSVYDLFDMSNNAVFALQDNEDNGIPWLYVNDTGEEFYVRHNDKVCVYLYKSMLSLTQQAAAIVAQTYTKSELNSMRLPGHLQKYLQLFW